MSLTLVPTSHNPSPKLWYTLSSLFAERIQELLSTLQWSYSNHEIPLSQCHYLLRESDFTRYFPGFRFWDIAALIYDTESKKVTRIRHTLSGANHYLETILKFVPSISRWNTPIFSHSSLSDVMSRELLLSTEVIYTVPIKKWPPNIWFPNTDELISYVVRHFSHNDAVILLSQKMIAYKIDTQGNVSFYTQNKHGKYYRWKSWESSIICLPVPALFHEMDSWVVLVEISNTILSQFTK